MTQRSLQRPGGDTIAATGNYAYSAACRRLSRLARSRLSSRASEHRKIRKTIRLTHSSEHVSFRFTVQKTLPLLQDGAIFTMLKILYRSCKNTVSFLYPLPDGNDSLRISDREFLSGEVSDLTLQHKFLQGNNLMFRKVQVPPEDIVLRDQKNFSYRFVRPCGGSS